MEVIVVKTLYLVRGLPGSGKSTFAAQLAEALGASHFEADMYFYQSGEYKFDQTQLWSAHTWCQNCTQAAMLGGKTVIVANTFTTEREMKPYLQLATMLGYKVVSLIVENRHGNLSIHDVPEETMTKMKNRFTVKL